MTSHSSIARRLLEICPDLALHIARCTEQAYRRGYQQGALYGHGLDQQVSAWRFDLPADHDDDTSLSARYDRAAAPPDRRDLGLHPPLQKAPPGRSYGYSTTAVQRLAMEAGSASEVISELAKLMNTI